jgi:hypothetical protein
MQISVTASSLTSPKPSEKKRTAVSGPVQRLVGSKLTFKN